MKKSIDLETSADFSGCYNGDKEYWDVYIDACKTSYIPTDLYIRQNKFNPYWNCYLFKVQYLKKQNIYHLIYKDF